MLVFLFTNLFATRNSFIYKGLKPIFANILFFCKQFANILAFFNYSHKVILPANPYKYYYLPQQFLYFLPLPQVMQNPVFMLFIVLIVLLVFLYFMVPNTFSIYSIYDTYSTMNISLNEDKMR